MGWILIIVIVFVCAFLLIARLYVGKSEKKDHGSKAPAASASDAGQDAADE